MVRARRNKLRALGGCSQQAGIKVIQDIGYLRFVVMATDVCARQEAREERGLFDSPSMSALWEAIFYLSVLLSGPCVLREAVFGLCASPERPRRST